MTLNSRREKKQQCKRSRTRARAGRAGRAEQGRAETARTRHNIRKQDTHQAGTENSTKTNRNCILDTSFWSPGEAWQKGARLARNELNKRKETHTKIRIEETRQDKDKEEKLTKNNGRKNDDIKQQQGKSTKREGKSSVLHRKRQSTTMKNFTEERKEAEKRLQSKLRPDEFT